MRQFAYNSLPVMPLRSNPDDRSEMVSQVLFGEHFFVNEIYSQWAKITLLNDNYQGWIDQKAVQKTTNEALKALKSQPVLLTSKLFTKLSSETETFYVPMGSLLPFYDQNRFKLQDKTYTITDPVAPFTFDVKRFTETCHLFLNVPYLWGGKTCFGIDCSGLTQVIMGQFGVQLSRDASMQVNQGSLVAFAAEAQTGDLAFFENDEGDITHVGIVLTPQTIMHAHGKVRIDALDDMGILNTETGKHSHRLRLIKRFF